MANPFSPVPIDFSMLSQLPQLYQQGQQTARENALRRAFSGSLPTLPDGSPDVMAFAKAYGQAGFPDQAAQMAMAAQKTQAELAKVYMPHYRADPTGRLFVTQGAGAGSYVTPPGGTGATPEMTKAQQAEDAAFAKTIPEWESGGQSEETQSLGALDEALGNLRASMPDPNTGAPATGSPVSGNVPGVLGAVGRNIPFGGMSDYATMGELIKNKPGYAAANYPKAVATMNSHVRAVAGGMKAILGGQRSQAIVQQIIGATYNADLPPEENIARLTRLRTNIDTAGKAKQSQVKWFKEHGTLAGYTGPNPEAIIGDGVSEFNASGTPDTSAQTKPSAQPTPAQMQLYQQHKNEPGFMDEWNKRFGTQ